MSASLIIRRFAAPAVAACIAATGGMATAQTAGDGAAAPLQASNVQPATRARHLKGSIRAADYPAGALSARAGGTVYLRFVVAPSGRVSGCEVTRSSGRQDLDKVTCRIIRKRFRYSPALDAEGRAVADVIVGLHEWEIAAPQRRK
jgi:protein TonB